jgi:hypothetical protein
VLDQVEGVSLVGPKGLQNSGLQTVIGALSLSARRPPASQGFRSRFQGGRFQHVADGGQAGRTGALCEFEGLHAYRFDEMGAVGVERIT